MHLIIDGFGANPAILESEEFIYQFLDGYPSEIEMTKVAPPHVFRYVGSKPQDWGVSGFVVIAESHISIHTFPERRLVNIDIFSCKEFDAERAMKDIRARFEIADMETHVLDRGLERYYVQTVESKAA
ncbi:MAG: adenosylmethionine decarboxylase [Chloroflexota bacterium]|nr:adenosylmethionine decarboxylase [Chloroflexota bacterium]